jgi:hypothetical protein
MGSETGRIPDETAPGLNILGTRLAGGWALGGRCYRSSTIGERGVFGYWGLALPYDAEGLLDGLERRSAGDSLEGRRIKFPPLLKYG